MENEKMFELLELIATEVRGLKVETEGIRTQLGKMDTKITDVQLTLENETNRSIDIIAEGHLDLNRKLDDALKVSNEKEIMLLRITRLENELRKLKEQVGAIA